jgi:hypothetical protein
VATVGAAALITLGCSACRDNLMGSSGTGTGSGGSQATTELSGIESTLNGVESDMNSDGSP